MSNHASSYSNTRPELVPKPLEPSVNPEDGSLLSAPLAHVLLAATSSLYNDVVQMAQGVVEITSSSALAAGGVPGGNLGDEDGTNHAAAKDEAGGLTSAALTVAVRREPMTSLSFAQRRHELAWRLAQHGRSLQNVAALTAAAASTDLAHVTRLASQTLHHTRTHWQYADEAQDALYFFHAQLFPLRRAPHDVYGALDVLIAHEWYDLPYDLQLTMPGYDSSAERAYSRDELDERWQLLVRQKLIQGEIGELSRGDDNRRRQQRRLWNVSLRGGLVHLTHGTPQIPSNLGIAARIETADDSSSTKSHASAQLQYPIEALLTVVTPSNADASSLRWTLLSLHVSVRPTTGEFHHQLQTSKQQQFDLHRLAARAMAVEEQRASSENAAGPPPRPLACLFRVAHEFMLSWVLELLSAQALALRRGVWAATSAAGSAGTLTVSPVRFEDGGRDDDVLGHVSVGFWTVDDSYGPPMTGILNRINEDEIRTTENAAIQSTFSSDLTGHLVLSVVASRQVGIQVFLSGASDIMNARRRHVGATVHELLEASANPFELSMSTALLAATRLCTEQRCAAVVKALQPSKAQAGASLFQLPDWMALQVDRGSVAVAASISYHGMPDKINGKTAGRTILFRMLCDARTGSFAPVFASDTELLRLLASNDLRASEALALSMASLPANRRRTVAVAASGRAVRDAFDGLIRSMNQLGHRVGVGGAWVDKETQSAQLRERSIISACSDVKVSLVKCCGMATMYGLAALTGGAATGLDFVPDRVGGPLGTADGIAFIPAPPISILLDQELVDKTAIKSDGVNKKVSFLSQSHAAFCVSIDEKRGPVVYLLSVDVNLASPSAFAQRERFSVIEMKVAEDVNGETVERPTKRVKSVSAGLDAELAECVDIAVEANRVAVTLESAIDSISKQK